MDYFEKYKEYVTRINRKYDKMETMLILQNKLNNFIWDVSETRPSIKEDTLAMLSELTEVLNELSPVWKWWSNKYKKFDTINKDHLVEEIVDFIHFYLTYVDILGREYNNDPVSYMRYVKELGFGKGVKYTVTPSDDINSEIIELYDIVSSISVSNFSYVEHLLSKIISSISKVTGTKITWDDIFNKYIEKSFENYMRQVEGGRYAKVDKKRFEEYIEKYWTV